VAYDTKIRETELAMIAELYEIRVGSNTTYYTSHNSDIFFDGNDYSARPLHRSDFRRDTEFKAVRVTITAPLDPLGLRYVANTPPEKVVVKITRLLLDGSDDYAVLFEGEVVSVTLKDFMAHAECEATLGIFRSRLPATIYQPRCNNALFDEKCGLIEISFQVPAIVTVSGSDLISSTFDVYDDGYFTGGYVEKTGDYRWITNHVGDTITLQAPFDTRVYTGSTVNAFPGCDGQPSTCQTKFGNFEKYRGFPYIPSSNPVIWGLK
jgi:uncharacterized phage protein (TIGR02218 family)